MHSQFQINLGPRNAIAALDVPVILAYTYYRYRAVHHYLVREINPGNIVVPSDSEDLL